MSNEIVTTYYLVDLQVGVHNEGVSDREYAVRFS